MQTTDFLVGKFTIQMRPNDLYCCPIKKDEQDINLHDRRLSYATLKTSTCFNKKCSETVWFYMNGNRDKSIVIYRLLKTPLHYVQFCSLKWSGILTCFFTTSSWCSTWSHGRSFMTIIPCWQEDHGKVDQASQTKWLFQKRLNREKKKNLFSCVKNIMRRQEKRGTLFHSAPENEEARNWCQLCFISLSVKSLCHSFLHRKLLKKIHHCAHTYEKYNHMLEWLEARCSDTHLQQVFWEAHQRPHLLCVACLTGPTTICIPQKPFHRWRYCLHPAHCSLPPGK